MHCLTLKTKTDIASHIARLSSKEAYVKYRFSGSGFKLLAFIWRENMLAYLSADISTSEKRTVCELDEGISQHIFAPNGDHYSNHSDIHKF